jgi:hypothetical protein
VVRRTDEGVGIRVSDPVKAEVLRRLRDEAPPATSGEPEKE